MVTLDPRYGIPVEPDREALRRIAAVRTRRRLAFVLRHAGLAALCALAGFLVHWTAPGPGWLGPLGALLAMLGCLGLAVRFINRLGYLMMPVLEAELWYFPANAGELSACQAAAAEGRMAERQFPEYAPNHRAFRWRQGFEPRDDS